jgi:hypothetical protein
VVLFVVPGLVIDFFKQLLHNERSLDLAILCQGPIRSFESGQYVVMHEVSQSTLRSYDVDGVVGEALI